MTQMGFRAAAPVLIEEIRAPNMSMGIRRQAESPQKRHRGEEAGLTKKQRRAEKHRGEVDEDAHSSRPVRYRLLRRHQMEGEPAFPFALHWKWRSGLS